MLLFTRAGCREAVAAGIVRFEFLRGSQNVADVLTKSLTYSIAHPLLEPILFWKGETDKSGSDKREQ